MIFSEPTEPIYTIGVVAKKFGISPETLRLYEREGLIIPQRSETRRRLYSQIDLEWIECIRHQITINRLNIVGIRRLLALLPCWKIKPCSTDDQQKCSAFTSNDVICWAVEQKGSRCVGENCSLCNVYHMANKIGHIKEFFELTEK